MVQGAAVLSSFPAYDALIADNEAWIRRGIIAKIRRHGFDFSWIGKASD